MNVKWLEDFLLLWETRNFTASAKKANISQAAFSRRILALENWLGHQLVDRSSSPVTFTEQGMVFKRDAADLLQRFSTARDNLFDPALGARSHVEILMPHVISSARFVKWWRVWSQGTNLTVSARIGNVSDIIASFLSGTGDILICHSGGTLPMMLNPNLYESAIIELDQFAPYTSIETLKAGRFPGTQSHPLPLALYGQGGYFAGLVENLMANSTEQLWGVKRVEADTALLLKQFIMNGEGVGWLPQCALAPDDFKSLKQVGGDVWMQKLPIIAYMKKGSPSVAARLVWEKLSADF